MVADSELQLFVRLRYFVKDELTVATILVRGDILWWRTRNCNYLFVCDILSKTHSRLRLFWFVAILYGGDSGWQLFVRLRYFVKEELTVATILVRGDILWWRTENCNYLFDCDILSKANSRLRYFVRFDILSKTN